jgi:RHS repeat-associated protein
VGTVAYAGTRAYAYDRAGQLTGDGTATYAYDAGGNRDMAGYATGTANRMTNDGTFTYTYDAEGNLTQKSKGSGQETWSYGYDNANHLTSVRETSDGTTNVLLLTYTYDVEGKRVKEQSWGGTGPAETRFASDGENVWADLDSGNAVTVRRLFGDRPDQVLTRTVASGPNAGLWFYQTDAQGSVRDLVNASSQVKAHLDYDGYGVRTDPQASVSDRYGYTGREWQADAGIQYNRGRDYLPAAGRWLQEDPIAFRAGDYNLTRYVRNDPVNRTDPSGLNGYYIVIGALMFGAAVGGGWLLGTVASGWVAGADSVSQAATRPDGRATLDWASQAMYGDENAWKRYNLFGVVAKKVNACFAAGTPLLTPEGSKPVEQFKEGDLVLSRGEADPGGRVQAKVVLEVFAEDAPVLELRVAGRVIRTTAEHPFWAVGRGWVAAGELVEGDRLLTPEGAQVAVEFVAQTVVQERVYNLRIADFRTYFVGCDEWGFSVWCHNACVYQSAEPGWPASGVVRYVGIAGTGLTNDLKDRLASAQRKTGWPARVIDGLGHVEPRQAECVEATLIRFHGRQSEGGTLMQVRPGNNVSTKRLSHKGGQVALR